MLGHAAMSGTWDLGPNVNRLLEQPTMEIKLLLLI